jgi:hypothetical protein
MGGGIRYKHRQRKTAGKRTHEVLRSHPNLEFQPLPDELTPESVLDYALENVALYVSPPKVKGEDCEFACDDLADALRTKLKPELLLKLQEKQASQ